MQNTELVQHPFLDAGGGGALGVRRDLLLAVGCFDKEMQTHEDIDPCWRLQLAGTPLRFAPRAVVLSDRHGCVRAHEGHWSPVAAG